ncbi:acetoin utilization protein AcuC, partial [Actinomadura adrarensis]
MSEGAALDDCGLQVLWDERLTSYDFGPGHPMNPIRIELTIALAREFGVLDHPNVTVAPFKAADDELLGLVHEEPYIAAVKHAGDTGLPDER